MVNKPCGVYVVVFVKPVGLAVLLALAGGIVNRPCGVFVVVCVKFVGLAVLLALAVLFAIDVGCAMIDGGWL